jgi:carotenoid 1,2-hydratase
MHSEHAGELAAQRAGTGRSAAAPDGYPDGLFGALPGDGWSPLWTGLARVGGKLPAARQPDRDPWALLRGRGDPSGRGGADGRLVGAVGEPRATVRPWFDEAVAPQGYRWWYVDAISDDGRHGLTIIAFIGSVFSPYYKRSGRGVPTDHSCLNVALYGPRGRWMMTERGAGDTGQSADQLSIGPSAMRWERDRLVIDIEERDIRLGVPWRRRVTGRVTVHPQMLNAQSFKLDSAGKHHWHAIAPLARVEVDMAEPGLRWSGSAYLDGNRGSESLEAGFKQWHWTRAHVGREVAVIYEGERRDGSPFTSALRFDRRGRVQEEELPPVAPLPRTGWLMERQTRADRGFARVVKTWEDAPFYARSKLAMDLFGQPVTAVQESIAMDRLVNPVVQFMLPYKMPREV